MQLAEPYRTMLGHLRHETGHYYWEVLVERARPARRSGSSSATSGPTTPRPSQRHYATPPAGWEEQYVSTYATAHPWEDWAETFAHYLHIRDTLQTAAAYGMRVDGSDAPPDPTPREGT